MNIHGTPYRTIWVNDAGSVQVINQVLLPHTFRVQTLRSLADVCTAIKDMLVRGAGLIGATAGYGMWLAACEAPDQNFLPFLYEAAGKLKATRPTASNLAWAVERQLTALSVAETPEQGRRIARKTAEAIADEDVDFCRRIGLHGLTVLQNAARAKTSQTPLNILTHCNAGWLAFVDYGSALAPVYAAHNEGIPVHVWVDETRPRNQGASLTAWELAQHGVPHTLIADNAGGHLMQHGLVDIVITGADRVTRSGDAANKIGTYLKALAAKDNAVPFYIAFPSSTLDTSINDGTEIPIEERTGDEVSYVSGLDRSGTLTEVRISPTETPARNWGFDVTPARLITGLICERGLCAATPEGLASLFPDRFGA